MYQTFFGGLQGFTQSFNVADKGQGVQYEDISASLNAGDLTITASGASAAGTFSLLPQANADGSLVTIAGFGANVGYTVQTIGTITAVADFESAAGSSTAVTVGPGTQASSGYIPQLGITFNIPGTNTGDDIIIGGNAGDSLSAGIGNVWIDGGAGNDLIYGGAGRDVLLGGDGADSITAGSGDTYLSGGDGNDTLVGGSGTNIIVGGAGVNTETGGIGNDTFIYGIAEADTINGGAGSNTLSFARRTSGVSFGLIGAQQTLDGGSIVNIQNLTGSEYNDSLTTAASGGVLKGLGGNDNLQGGAGNDIIEGGAGADIVAGNGGNNTASYEGSSAGVYVNLATGTTIGGDATGDVLSNIQNLTGSNYGDELAGDAGVNIINTGIGDDYIDATAGADTYNGGDGFDTVDYSLTNFVAGSGTVSGSLPYAPYYYSYVGTISAVAITLYATSGSVTFRNADGTTGTHALSSIEQFIGTASNDSFSSAGTALNITWDGSGGSDTYSGGTGSDTYVYGLNYGVSTITDSNAASNTIRLKAGVTFDNLWVANASGSLKVGIRGSSSYIQANSNFPTVGNNVTKFLDLSGSGQVDITQSSTVSVGTDGADTLYGSSTTSNIIFAYNGNDTIYASNGVYSQSGNVIYGGLGNDVITTSVGDDQFLFERGNGQDTVYDSGGQNSLIFGPTAGTNDVIYQVVGNDLYVGLADLNDSSLTASQVADSVKFVGAGVVLHDTRTNIDTRNTSIIVQVGGVTTDLSKANINWTIQNYASTPPGGGGGGGGGGCRIHKISCWHCTGRQLKPRRRPRLHRG